MNVPLFSRLFEEGLITSASYEKIKTYPAKQLFSVHWEIRAILYLGILLLTGGLGVLVYKNIDSIGHQAILAIIATICAGSFYYCFKNKLPFSKENVRSPNAYFDYILLLACLSFIIFIGYFQYQYHIFGNRYGLATFFPMLLLFFCAYYFDHLAVLSLAITNLGAWLGITVTPLKLLEGNDFNSTNIIFTGILLGTGLIFAGQLSSKKNYKAHFKFTYSNFGMNVLFVSTLSGMFRFENAYMLWFLFVAGAGCFFYWYAKGEQSFYILLMSTLYVYIALTYVILTMLFDMNGIEMAAIYGAFIYFIVSGIGLVVFLMRTNKIFKNR